MPSYSNDALNAAVTRVLAGESRRAVNTETKISYRSLGKWTKNAENGVFREPARRGPAPLLSALAEVCLAEWVIGRQVVGHPVSRKEIIYNASTMIPMATGKTVGFGSHRRFMDRHPNLVVRTSQTVTKARSSVTTEDTERIFYSLVKAVAENSMGASCIQYG